MKNPSSPYPGRQLFLGRTPAGRPTFVYLVTGRSPQSRERKATPLENGVVIGPIGDTPYDSLRHYIAVKYDNTIGLLAVSNGIQTEAVFETYRLLFNVKSMPAKGYLKKIMEGARTEPDSLNTPRVAGVISSDHRGRPVFIIGIKTTGKPAFAWRIEPVPGILTGVATYNGDMESPGAFRVAQGLPEVKCDAEAPERLAKFIYGISEAASHGEDIRVCAVGGMWTGNEWSVALVNRHEG